MKPLTDAAFEREVLRADQPVIVSFQAPWSNASSACQASLERVAAEFESSIACFVVNVDEEPSVVSHYDMRQLPVLALYREGALVATHEGMISELEVRDLFELAFELD